MDLTGTLLALKLLDQMDSFDARMTFSPALELQVDDGFPCEADYVAWIHRERYGENLQPKLVIGEAKSFGKGDLIKPHDLERLRRIAKKLPGATIVISVLRDYFTKGEKRTLLPFVNWARRLNKNWAPTNPVILLTGVELFYEFDLGSTWSEKGGPYAEFADLDYTYGLEKLSEATQTIYLGLPPFVESQRVASEKRRSKGSRRSAST